MYAKAGNIWVQTGKDAAADRQRRRLDAVVVAGRAVDLLHPDPATETGRWPVRGTAARLRRSTIPDLMRVTADGSADPERLVDAAGSSKGSCTWFYWMRQPVVSPDGKTIALVTDAPEPRGEQRRPPVLRHRHEEARRSRRSPRSGRSATRTRVAARRQVPAVRAERPRRGARRAGHHPLRRRDEEGRARSPAPGYLEPSYSPDGRYIAATKTSRSAPTSSSSTPRRPRAAARHRRRRVVGADLVAGRRRRSRSSTSTARSSTCSWPGSTGERPGLDGQGDDRRLTEVSGLDAASRPDWFIPARPAARRRPRRPTAERRPGAARQSRAPDRRP